MTADALGPVDRSHDAEIIRDLRAQRAKLDERDTTEAWSLRLTFGEIDALLRAVDDRDDAVRRLVGEWEGDVPEPLPVVEVAPYVGELGEVLERPDDADPGEPFPARNYATPCPSCSHHHPGSTFCGVILADGAAREKPTLCECRE